MPLSILQRIMELNVIFDQCPPMLMFSPFKRCFNAMEFKFILCDTESLRLPGLSLFQKPKNSTVNLKKQQLKENIWETKIST